MAGLNWIQWLQKKKLKQTIMEFMKNRHHDFTVENMGSVTIFGDDWQKKVELDGVLRIDDIDCNPIGIITVEVNHSVTNKWIDDRVEKLTTFVLFIKSIPDNHNGDKRKFIN